MLNIFWQKLFLILILFIAIDFLIAGIFFYVYYSKTQLVEPVSPLLLSVNQVLLEDIFSKWDEKEVKFQEVMTREFPNFFREVIIYIPPVEATSTEGVSIFPVEVSGE